MSDYLSKLPEDPGNIVLNYTTIDGLNSVTFADLDEYLKTIVVLAIVFGTRIGLSAIALPVNFLVTKNKRSPIFILNTACLCILFLQSCLFSVTLTKYYNTIAFSFSMYENVDTLASNISIAANVLYVILIALVEISFCYQVYIIFESPQTHLKRLGYVATALSAFLGLASVVMYFMYMVYSNITFLNPSSSRPGYLVNTPLILFVTSSCAICFMLLLKLGVAIRTRRYLGLTQFNLFHILFVMTFQTMIIPTVLILISFNAFSETDQYSSQSFSALGTALITISLPLTTMWANSSVSNSTPSSTVDMYSPYPSSDDNKTLAESPLDYYPKSSLSDSESFPGMTADPEKQIIGDYQMKGMESSAKTDEEFWKEVELYTKDLDKHSQNGSIHDSGIKHKSDKVFLSHKKSSFTSSHSSNSFGSRHV